MSELFLLLSPFVVSLLSSAVKKFIAGPLSVLKNGYRRGILRFIVALLAYGSIIGGASLSGVAIDPAASMIFVEAFGVFLASSGVYFIAKKK